MCPKLTETVVYKYIVAGSSCPDHSVAVMEAIASFRYALGSQPMRGPLQIKCQWIPWSATYQDSFMVNGIYSVYFIRP